MFGIVRLQQQEGSSPKNKEAAEMKMKMKGFKEDGKNVFI